MTITKRSLAEVTTGHAPKICVYGAPGVGKTTLIASLTGKILILSAEAGLLSLDGADLDADVVEVQSLETLRAVYAEIKASPDVYDWVVLDSISEIGEVVLSSEKAKSKDPRAAYGNLQESMLSIMRAFRDLPCGVYFSAKMASTKDEATGRVTHTIGMPGAKLGDAIPYLFDEVFRLVVIEEDGDDGKKVASRYLLTATDGKSTAKDRSGRLDAYEPADLGAIVAKIGGAA